MILPGSLRENINTSFFNVFNFKTHKIKCLIECYFFIKKHLKCHCQINTTQKTTQTT